MSEAETKLRDHFAAQDLDIRHTASQRAATGISPRFVDQKTTPDVLSFIAECVLELDSVQQADFVVADIWQHEHFKKGIQQIWGKPLATELTARREYDKFIPQPLKLLVFAGVLANVRRRNRLHFSVVEESMLTYVAQSVNKANNFLYEYFSAVLEQSGLLPAFERFRFSSHTAEDFADLKQAFEKAIHDYLPIRSVEEPRRMFPKVLNVLATRWGIPGTRDGRVTKYAAMHSDLMYNVVNFRDVTKSKSTTRALATKPSKQAEAFVGREMEKAKSYIRRRHGPNSELSDRWGIGSATQVHHIVPVNERPDMRSMPENMILLTATQHQAKAHPDNVTARIDRDYQIDCLIAKLESVKHSLIRSDGFYSHEDYLKVVAAATGLTIPIEVPITSIPSRLRAKRAGDPS